MMNKEQNNLKRRLKRNFKRIDKIYKNENFEDVLFRDINIDGMWSKYISYNLLDIERTKGMDRFYLLRYCYANHINVIGNMNKNHIDWKSIMFLLDKKRQVIITFKKVKELLFPMAMIDPHRVGVWLKQYRKFYNKYIFLKRRIVNIVGV